MIELAHSKYHELSSSFSILFLIDLCKIANGQLNLKVHKNRQFAGLALDRYTCTSLTDHLFVDVVYILSCLKNAINSLRRELMSLAQIRRNLLALIK